jgi:hypothetical protein
MGSTITQRDKHAEALEAYRNGTTRDLPGDNPYRYLVQTHYGNPAHRGMQPNCPACGAWSVEDEQRESIRQATADLPSTAYVGRHHTGRTAHGLPDFPWTKVDGYDLAVGVDTNRPDETVLMLNGDHDGVMIRLTATQVARLRAQLEQVTA